MRTKNGWFFWQNLHLEYYYFLYFKQMLPPPHGGVSDSEVLDVETHGGKLSVSPRVSMSATEDDLPSESSTPKRKFSKFNIGKFLKGSEIS